MVLLKIGGTLKSVNPTTLKKVPNAIQYAIGANDDVFFLGDTTTENIKETYLNTSILAKESDLLEIPHTGITVPLWTGCTVKDILNILIEWAHKTVPIDAKVIMNLYGRVVPGDDIQAIEANLNDLIDGKLKFTEYWNADHNCLQLNYGPLLSKSENIWHIHTTS